VTQIEVHCDPAGDGWECAVTVHEGGSSTEHRVGVALADLADLAPGSFEPDDLVRASFAFLLEREPKESILGSFDLPLIGRYFPEYRRTIRDRMLRGDV
jgi:hypothetical protein